MYYAELHNYGSKSLVFICEGACPWTPHLDPVIESKLLPRREARKELRQMKDQCVRMNGGT